MTVADPSTEQFTGQFAGHRATLVQMVANAEKLGAVG